MVALSLAVGSLVVGGGTAPIGAQGPWVAQEAESTDEDVVTVDAAPELIDEVAGELVATGWYVEEGAGVPADELAEVREAMLAAGSEWGLVALTTPPTRGTRNFAANLLAEVRSNRSRIDTVVVLTLEDVSGASRTASEDELDAAFEAAIPTFEVDVIDGFGVAYEELTGAALPEVESGSGGGLSVSLPLVVAGGLVAAAVVALVAALMARRSRQQPAASAIPPRPPRR